MSEDEQNLRRLKSWDKYQAAKNSYLSHRDRLIEWGNVLRPLGLALITDQMSLTNESYRSVPSMEDFSTGIEEFGKAVAELKRAWVCARDYGFPVDPNDLKEVGGL